VGKLPVVATVEPIYPNYIENKKNSLHSHIIKDILCNYKVTNELLFIDCIYKHIPSIDLN